MRKITNEQQAAIYARHDNAAKGVEAFCLIHKGALIGRLVIRGRATSQGRTVRAWLHILTSPMVEGVTNGGGYDMASAAVADAASKLTFEPGTIYGDLAKVLQEDGSRRFEDKALPHGISLIRAI